MSTLLIVLLVLLILGAWPAYNYGGPWGGGSVGLLVLILVILLLMGRV
jgi:hypothetical protein